MFATMPGTDVTTRLRPADLVSATPVTRDRYIDFLRAASIVVVILGHWSMAVVSYRNGSWQMGNLLTFMEQAWLLAWVFQVMPVFFFVGGFSNMGPFPRSMVGLPGEIWNMNPPTVCLLALTVWQVSALLVARRPALTWLQRPRAWGAVIATNSIIMTMFLRHFIALMISQRWSCSRTAFPSRESEPPAGGCLGRFGSRFFAE